VKRIIFDIGANKGKDSIRWNTKDEIHLFEAHDESVNQLKKTFFKFDDVIINHVAVSDVDGESPFYIDEEGYSSSLLPLTEVGEKFIKIKTIQQVRTIRLDTYIQSIGGVDRIDWLKIDTQGMDLKILQSLGKWIDIVRRGRVEVRNPYIQFWENSNNDWIYVSNWLEDKGFQILNRSELEDNISTKDGAVDWDIKFVRKGGLI
jgi:FkbM family methyltransferase